MRSSCSTFHCLSLQISLQICKSMALKSGLPSHPDWSSSTALPQPLEHGGSAWSIGIRQSGRGMSEKGLQHHRSSATGAMGEPFMV